MQARCECISKYTGRMRVAFEVPRERVRVDRLDAIPMHILLTSRSPEEGREGLKENKEIHI